MPELEKTLTITCDVNTQTITRHGEMWIVSHFTRRRNIVFTIDLDYSVGNVMKDLV